MLNLKFLKLQGVRISSARYSSKQVRPRLECVMIFTFHILKLSGYHNINIYILVLILNNIKLNCYYKTKLLIMILTSVL